MTDTPEEIGYCSLYINLDAEPADRLVVNEPFHKSPAGPIATLLSLRLEKASGLVVGGPLPKVRHFLSSILESDKAGQLTESKDSKEILDLLAARAVEFGLSVDHRQLGPGQTSGDKEITESRLPVIPVLTESRFKEAVSALVLTHLKSARSHGLSVSPSSLVAKIQQDSGVAILTVESHVKDDKVKLTPLVKAWDFGATTVRPGSVLTSLVVHPDQLRFTSPGSLDMAWSLWVRTGRPWSYSESTGPK